jgi:hypothetical protein
MLQKFRQLSLPQLTPNRKFRGQSFLELALILPVLLILLLGLIEVAFYIGRYLDILDLTREAARFASVRNPFSRVPSSAWDCGPAQAGTELPFDFYYNTACIFSPPNTGTCSTTDPEFCNGLNSYMDFDPATDDIVITVFTTTYWTAPHAIPSVNPQVTDMHPEDSANRLNNYWAYSEHDSDTTHNANWSKDCADPPAVVHTEPYYNNDKVNSFLSSDSSFPNSPNKGLVAVEYYFCYRQVLGVPLITSIIPNPMRIHAYTLMPVPAAQPTPTPR